MRCRWLLPLAVFCALLAGVLLRELSYRDPVQVMFDRVHPGMTPEEVNDVITGYLGTGHFPEPSLHNRFGVAYTFEHSTVSVDFFHGRVLNSVLHRYPKPTIWERLRFVLERVRVAVGL
jgi:hypothetical protein